MGDNYRPGRSTRDRPPRPPVPLANRMTFTSGGGDNYRPGGQQRPTNGAPEFTFQSSHPAPRFPPVVPGDAGSRNASKRRPRGGASQRDNNRGNQPQGGRRNIPNNARGRGGFRKPTHERALLQKRDMHSPERTWGVSTGSNRFRNLEDLTDDEEQDMDESESSDGEIKENKKKNGIAKVARKPATVPADGDSIPKWSNPDPYALAPTPQEDLGKRVDFVALIRKAKNEEAAKAAGDNAVAANDDFIAFDMEPEAPKGPKIPSGPKALRQVEDDGPGLHSQNSADDQPTGKARNKRQRQRLPSLEKMDAETAALPRQLRSQATMQGSMNQFTPLNNLPPRPTFSHADNLPAPTIPERPQQPARNKKRRHEDTSGPFADEWVPKGNSNQTPWIPGPTAYNHIANQPSKWLHNEMLDFCDFVTPQDYEQSVRQDLVKRVNNALGPARFGNARGRILAFGSFPAGLYLPTADMDLVYASENYSRGGPPAIDSTEKGAHKPLLRGAAKIIQRKGICEQYPIVIAMAKVPIIKFKDRMTGLQVDISFENLSGVVAQETFKQWKSQYKDVKYMVPLVKQFLSMRNLNEVHTGGLGGFSIICLVVCYLHHHPVEDNLGESFLGFLKFYGIDFKLSKQRITMDPIAIVPKGSWDIDGRETKATGLSIQDPNRPDNNISGGSHKAVDAFKAFKVAYETMRTRMSYAEQGHDLGPSILKCILGGNYESYIAQRQRMEALSR